MILPKYVKTTQRIANAGLQLVRSKKVQSEATRDRGDNLSTLGDMTRAPCSRLYRLDMTSSRSLVFFTGKNL